MVATIRCQSGHERGRSRPAGPMDPGGGFRRDSFCGERHRVATPNAEVRDRPVPPRRAGGVITGRVAVSELIAGPEVVDLAGERPLIEFAGLEKSYQTGKVSYRALRGVDLSIAAGEMVAVVGPSGSGKSTLLNMITGIDRPTAGTVTFDGRVLDQLSEEDLAVCRGANVGIIFQFFQLLPTLSALENAVLSLDFLRRGSKHERFAQARRNLEMVGLGTSSNICRPSCPVGSSNGWRSRARSPLIRG